MVAVVIESKAMKPHSNLPLLAALSLADSVSSGKSIINNPALDNPNRPRAYRKKMKKSVLDRLMEKVVLNGKCWNWTGKKDDFGYGKLSIRDKTFQAHRVAYTILEGDIPEGMILDHQCNNPACVNPGHHKPMTQRDNLLRANTFQATNAAKTHCVNGHPFSATTVYITKRGGRQCRICVRERKKKLRQRVKGVWSELLATNPDGPATRLLAAEV